MLGFAPTVSTATSLLLPRAQGDCPKTKHAHLPQRETTMYPFLFFILILIGLSIAINLRPLPSSDARSLYGLTGFSYGNASKKQAIAGAAIMLFAATGIFITGSMNINNIIDSAAVSCTQDESESSFCVPELEEKLGVDTEEVLKTAEESTATLNDDQRAAFTELACTVPGKELHLTTSLPSTAGGESTEVWRMYAENYTTTGGTKYIALPDNYSAGGLQKAANDYYKNRANYTVQWAAPEGGWITNESHTSWDDLLENRMRSWSDAKDLTLAPGLTQTISCEGK